MSSYNPAGKEAYDLLKEVMGKYDEHAQLIAAKVTIDFLFAFGKEAKDGTISDALKHNGVKALALISRNGLKERTLGHADALLQVDGRWWNEASHEERVAILDHELYHLDLKRDDEFAVEYDDAQRPKIVMRKHDHQFGHFILIAKRHGMHSQECKQMAQIREEAGQYYWPDMCGAQIAEHSEEQADSDKFLAQAKQLSAATSLPEEDRPSITISTEGLPPLTLSPKQLKQATKNISAGFHA